MHALFCLLNLERKKTLVSCNKDFFSVLCLPIWELFFFFFRLYLATILGPDTGPPSHWLLAILTFGKKKKILCKKNIFFVNPQTLIWIFFFFFYGFALNFLLKKTRALFRFKDSNGIFLYYLNLRILGGNSPSTRCQGESLGHNNGFGLSVPQLPQEKAYSARPTIPECIPMDDVFG